MILIQLSFQKIVYIIRFCGGLVNKVNENPGRVVRGKWSAFGRLLLYGLCVLYWLGVRNGFRLLYYRRLGYHAELAFERGAFVRAQACGRQVALKCSGGADEGLVRAEHGAFYAAFQIQRSERGLAYERTVLPDAYLAG